MRNNPLPDWLSSWTDAGMQLETTANAPLQLYQNNFNAGTVELGANEKGNSMYVVIVDQQNTNTQPPPAENNPGPGETEETPTDTQTNTEDTPDTESGGMLGIVELIMLLLTLLVSRAYIPAMRNR
jgi:hypothetical protein